MKDSILLELANRWEANIAKKGDQKGSPEAMIPNAIEKGIREGKQECIDGLRSLVKLLGDGK